jgi:hypothetical protein
MKAEGRENQKSNMNAEQRGTEQKGAESKSQTSTESQTGEPRRTQAG